MVTLPPLPLFIKSLFWFFSVNCTYVCWWWEVRLHSRLYVKPSKWPALGSNFLRWVFRCLKTFPAYALLSPCLRRMRIVGWGAIEDISVYCTTTPLTGNKQRKHRWECCKISRVVKFKVEINISDLIICLGTATTALHIQCVAHQSITEAQTKTTTHVGAHQGVLWLFFSSNSLFSSSFIYHSNMFWRFWTLSNLKIMNI